jgi:DNA-binding Lrp family transcriptional regulator
VLVVGALISPRPVLSLSALHHRIEGLEERHVAKGIAAYCDAVALEFITLTPQSQARPARQDRA